MPSTTPLTPIGPAESTPPYPRPPTPDAHELPEKRAAHHPAAFAPPQHIPFVAKTMGAAPMAEVEALQLLAGIPIPANLGPNIDTTA